MKQMDSHKKSFLKSAIWRIMGVIILALITYYFTGELITTGLITLLHHGVFLVVYYLHERLWIKIGDRILGKKRSAMRAFLYEIVLGNSILFLISLLVGDVTGMVDKFTKAFLITFTYTSNKLWIYVAYDWLWKRKWTWLRKKLRRDKNE